MKFRTPEGQIARCLQKLQHYDFKVLHREGRKHGNADAMSTTCMWTQKTAGTAQGRSETRPLQLVPSATDNAKTGRAVQPVSRGPPERTKERPFSRDYHQLAGSQSNTAQLERGVSSKSGGEELLEALGVTEHPRRCPDVPLGDSQPRSRYLASGPSAVHEMGRLESAS